jgi:molecular chaperone DnaK
MSDLEGYAGKTIFGIDLGTTKSGLAIYRPSSGKVEMVRDAAGNSTIPSMVAWDREHERWLVGHEAKAFAREHPQAAARSIKRYIGRLFTDATVAELLSERAFTVESGAEKRQIEDIFVNFGTNRAGDTIRLSAPEVSAKVLARLRQTLLEDEEFKNHTPDDLKYAVITVPAYFNAWQREATKLAGRFAGLEVVDIINEPTASALAYHKYVLEMDKTLRIMVYDLGGGTFDVSILQASRDADGFSFDTEVVDGNTRLGGDDIDKRITDWLVGQIEQERDCRIAADDYLSRERLRQAGEAAKILLSQPDTLTTTVRVDELAPGGCEPFGIAVDLTREKLEECAQPTINETRDICNRAVYKLLNKTWADIDAVVLVGGPTQMPLLRREIAKFSSREPFALPKEEGVAGPQEAVALGAGEYAHTLSLGGRHFQERALQHVVALPVGIHIYEPAERFEKLIRANSPLPVEGKHVVTTTKDGQTYINVDVLQGKEAETDDPKQCHFITTVHVPNLAPERKGYYLFEVTVKVQEDGTLGIAVKNLRTDEELAMETVTDTRITTFAGTAQVRATG